MVRIKDTLHKTPIKKHKDKPKDKNKGCTGPIITALLLLRQRKLLLLQHHMSAARRALQEKQQISALMKTLRDLLAFFTAEPSEERAHQPCTFREVRTGFKAMQMLLAGTLSDLIIRMNALMRAVEAGTQSRELTLREKLMLGIPAVQPSGPDLLTDPDFATAEMPLAPRMESAFAAWKRPPDVREELCVVAGDRVEPGYVWQGKTGSCALVAAIESVAVHDAMFGSDMLASCIFPQVDGKPVVSPSGMYAIRLHWNGCARAVVIDDRFPVDSKDQWICSESMNRRELWPMLLEKAYMKLRGGYTGSVLDIELGILTGWIPSSGAEMYDQMIREEKAHVYTMVDIWESRDGTLRLVKLRILWRWGNGFWKGRFSKWDSVSWTPELQSELHYDIKAEQKRENAFLWMCWEDVAKHCPCVHAVWAPECFPFRQVLSTAAFAMTALNPGRSVAASGHWSDVLQGGCSDHPSLYRVAFNSKDAKATTLKATLEASGTKSEVGVALMHADMRKGMLECLSGSCIAQTSPCTAPQAVLQRAVRTIHEYLVVCCTSVPGVVGGFGLRVESMHAAVTLRPVRMPWHHLRAHPELRGAVGPVAAAPGVCEWRQTVRVEGSAAELMGFVVPKTRSW
eukprot:m51a1_g4678 putative calpain-7 (626) ;mRNA; f:146910-152968